MTADVHHATSNCYVRQVIASGEGKITNVYHAVGNRHPRQAITIIERPRADGRYTARNRHARQIVTIIECVVVYLIILSVVIGGQS